MSRRVLPVCGNLCCFCPSMRASSRQPVKRYKKLLGEIFPRSQVNIALPLYRFTCLLCLLHVPLLQKPIWMILQLFCYCILRMITLSHHTMNRRKKEKLWRWVLTSCICSLEQVRIGSNVTRNLMTGCLLHDTSILFYFLSSIFRKVTENEFLLLRILLEEWQVMTTWTYWKLYLL